MKIYHNPRCSKSRETLALIQAAGIKPEVIEYLKAPPSVGELEQICHLLGVEPQQLVRCKEAQALNLDLKQARSREEWLALLHQYPQLIERPIVISGERAILGRPPENVKALL